MKTTKNVINKIIFFVCVIFPPSVFLFAQTTTVIDTLAYTQISNLTDIQVTSRIKANADGSKIIFTGNFKRIYTMKTDGSELKQVFDYNTFRGGCPCIDPFIDISGDGSTILWTDGINEIFTADFDGSNMETIATLIPVDPPFADVEPVIHLPPRLTYDGSKVFFFNVAGGKDFAGFYMIGSNGSGLTKLFSYKEMSQNVFGLDGTEFNPNTAFTNFLDISDDGSKVIFATHNIDINKGHTITYGNSTLQLLRNYAPLFTHIPTGIGALSISRDGSKVVIPFRENDLIETVHIMDFNGDNQIELPYVFSSSATFQLDSSGLNMLATNHLPEYGGSIPLPVSIINLDSSRILDLTLLEGNPKVAFRGARASVFTYNAKTVFFINEIVREDSLEQIWELDINPDSLINHPIISNINFSPGYVFFDKSNSSTFKVTVSPTIGSILYVNWDTFMEGSYVFRGLRTFGTTENLVDDGTLGDVVAHDGIYTREGIFADLFEPPAVLTVRIHADAGKYITSVDLSPFSILDSLSTSIDNDLKQNFPDNYELYANYPNPFNPTTTITYSLPNSSLVILKIYDLLGREIETLINEEKDSGTYKVIWNAQDIPSGTYFYKITAGEYSKTNKMILLK